MSSPAEDRPAFVVKAADFAALYYLDSTHPRPQEIEWINRGTDQRLRPSTIDMLLRTMWRPSETPSVRKLHESAGLRTIFRSERDRDRFARAFRAARGHLSERKEAIVSAVFATEAAAEKALAALKEAGVPQKAMSLVWRTSHYLDQNYEAQDGHEPTDVALSTMGGGIAGALLGVGVLFVPGVGPVAVAGALTSSAFASIATVSGIIGATGGAIAKMLSDHDVDGVAASLYEDDIRRGKVFVSVDTRECEDCRAAAQAILANANLSKAA